MHPFDTQNECSLHGIIDMHVHASPDAPAHWWGTDKRSLLEQYRAEGCRGVLLIGNNWPTHNEAFLLSRLLPGIQVFGGMVLNLCQGQHLNLTAVERCLSDDAGAYCRCIWLPTMDADFDLRRKGKTGIPVLDGTGQPLPSTLDLMALCRDAGIMLATGHSGPEASLALAKAAKNTHLEKFIVTQSMLSPRALTIEQAKRCLDEGAFLEHVVLALFKGEGHSLIPAHRLHARTTVENMARCMELAPERQFIGSDMNQALNPHPLAALQLFLHGLKEAGLSRDSILAVSRRVPARLLGLET